MKTIEVNSEVQGEQNLQVPRLMRLCHNLRIMNLTQEKYVRFAKKRQVRFFGGWS